MSVAFGLPAPFSLLFDQAEDAGLGLPESLRSCYGEWQMLPASADRPYLYVNFVISRDGRIALNLPGHNGGGEISERNPYDRWLMALLRARADATMVGAATIREMGRHRWTAEALLPQFADTWAALRQSEGRAPTPIQIFLTRSGDLPPGTARGMYPDLHVVVATTRAGRVRLLESAAPAGRLDVLDLGEETVNLTLLLRRMRKEYGVQSLLCEGGPQVYGALLDAELVDDEFLTLSPLVVGNPADGRARPGLVEGVAYGPGQLRRSKLLSVRRVEDFLFLRSRYPA